jgi:hypothetical protein
MSNELDKDENFRKWLTQHRNPCDPTVKPKYEDTSILEIGGQFYQANQSEYLDFLIERTQEFIKTISNKKEDSHDIV